jgi:hypothetical protein
MLLIISEDEDLTTSEVINWLQYQKTKFVRINSKTKVELESFALKDDKIFWSLRIFKADSKSAFTLTSDEISAYWYRRGYLNVESGIEVWQPLDQDLLSALDSYVNNNNRDWIEIIYDSFRHIKHIGSIKDNYLNKLHCL